MAERPTALKVSILICTHGEAHWRELAIQRALPSAQAQKEAHEIRVFHSPEGTLAGVRNAAAREATGDALCFLDADDELAPGYVHSMAEARSQRDSDALLYPAVQYVYGRRVDQPVMLGRGRQLIELNRCVIGTLVPRDLFVELGGFGDEPLYEDWDLWLRCSQRLEVVGVPGAVYRVHVRELGRNRRPRAEARRWYDEIRSRYETRSLPA